jgi:hypothetical protein
MAGLEPTFQSKTIVASAFKKKKSLYNFTQIHANLIDYHIQM